MIYTVVPAVDIANTILANTVGLQMPKPQDNQAELHNKLCDYVSCGQRLFINMGRFCQGDELCDRCKMRVDEIEALLARREAEAERRYFDSVLRSRAKTDPDITIKEWHDRHFQLGVYKPNYTGQALNQHTPKEG